METTKKELEEMDSFVNMLINEGAEKGIPFYVNLKNRETEKKTNKKSYEKRSL